MVMPNNLLFVRHGQSEANIIQKACKNGDDSLWTEDFVTVPDRTWRLTNLGTFQAEIAGKWIQSNIPHFDRYIVSPFVRTRETAALLNLPNVAWEENRSVRERSWGEIDSIPLSRFRELYPLNAAYKDRDPLYWNPPAGEAIADVAENRVRNLLNTLHRENEGDNVLIVSHGEFMWAVRLVLERWSDEEFIRNDSDPEYKIHNCSVFHYTRINPETGEQASKLKWFRKMYPSYNTKTKLWEMKESEWKFFDRQRLTNAELLERAKQQIHRIHTNELTENAICMPNFS